MELIEATPGLVVIALVIGGVIGFFVAFSDKAQGALLNSESPFYGLEPPRQWRDFSQE